MAREKLNLKPIPYFIGLILICILFDGCSMFYYGHTKSEWNSLSESEKRAAKEEYQWVMETKKIQGEETAINERADSFEDFGIKKTVP